MSEQTSYEMVRALYRELLEEGVRYFFPEATLEVVGRSPSLDLAGKCMALESGRLHLDWMGTKYLLRTRHERILPEEERLVESISRVLSARYRLIFGSNLEASSLSIFRGLPEDRYVSAFLEPDAYSDPAAAGGRDRIAQALEVLRLSALTTYENQRTATGVLLFGSEPDPCHTRPVTPPAALPYARHFTTTRSFYRLCDGIRTAALVDPDGRLAELVDIQQWAEPFSTADLPVPCPERYQIHARSTLCGGHIFLVLTPHGEIKVIARGAQTFSFRDGRWHLTDAQRKCELWTRAARDELVAGTLLQTALNLAEDRRGALFVVVDHSETASALVDPADRLDGEGDDTPDPEDVPRRQFRYLLSDKYVADLAPRVLESVARIDGAIVIGPDGRLLAFGAILRPQLAGGAATAEGGRSAAALAASLHGRAIKVSEDGVISFFERGRKVWDL